MVLVVVAVAAVIRRPAVLVLGDSITELGAAPLAADLRWAYRGSFIGHSGYRVDELLPEARAQAPGAPDRVILNVGTNDALQGWPLDQSIQSLQEMGRLFAGTRCLAFVTVNENVFNPNRDVAASARAINDVIRAVAAEHHADVIDWSAYVRDRDQPTQPDGALTLDLIHPTERGYVALAGLYEERLARCP